LRFDLHLPMRKQTNKFHLEIHERKLQAEI